MLRTFRIWITLLNTTRAPLSLKNIKNSMTTIILTNWDQIMNKRQKKKPKLRNKEEKKTMKL